MCIVGMDVLSLAGRDKLLLMVMGSDRSAGPPGLMLAVFYGALLLRCAASISCISANGLFAGCFSMKSASVVTLPDIARRFIHAADYRG
ncbi:MAG TPA: hypothetical protein VHW69_04795 [Rhizomicrobium sp.]|jgi:hypothetical protein|nr:hypothetical protein [Rhizomicrobium sp.]